MHKPSRFLSIGCAAAFLLPLLGNRLDAAVLFSLSDSAGAADSVTINPGDTFDVTAFLSSDTLSLLGMSYQLTVSSAGSALFSLTGRNIMDAPYTSSDLTTSNAILFNGINNVLDPTTNVDLGATFDAIAPGLYTMAVYSIATGHTLAAGVYILSFSNAGATDSAFNDVTASTATYTVTVVPEPSAAALLGAAMIGLAVRRVRRKENRTAS